MAQRGHLASFSANNRNRSLKSEFIEISAFDHVGLRDHFPSLRELFFIAERGPGSNRRVVMATLFADA